LTELRNETGFGYELSQRIAVMPQPRNSQISLSDTLFIAIIITIIFPAAYCLPFCVNLINFQVNLLMSLSIG
jgi:hypothetical protein